MGPGNHQPEISFCLPVYNVQKYLQDCITSIIRQNLQVPFEIFCIDDCSTDESIKELQRLRDTLCADIRIDTNVSNRGVCYTRNRLIREARGSYIWFVDPDDMLMPQAANALLTEIMKHGTDAVLGNYARVEENTHYDSLPVRSQSFSFQTLCTNDPLYRYVPVDQGGTRMHSVWSGIFRRDFFLSNQLFFHEGMIAQEDTLFEYEWALRTDSVMKTELPVYAYRIRSGSVMHSLSEQRNQAYYQSIKVMYDVYTKHLQDKDYNNEGLLQEKLHHTRENLALRLALCTSPSFVKENMKELRKTGAYPYPFRRATLRRPRSMIYNIMTFMLPVYPFFWLNHWIFVLGQKKS